MKYHLPFSAQRINIAATIACSLLEREGHEASLVGGCVRDLIMRRSPKDWDICTDAEPEEIIRVFENANWDTIPTGIQHGTITVVDRINHPNTPCEITTYRCDGAYSDGRHPDSVTFGKNLIEDMERRDFTMNAIAMIRDLDGGLCLQDYFKGTKDIGDKCIRCVGDPNRRLSEDALRMMRAIRFSCQLNFYIEKNTFDAISANKDRILYVSKERIHDELVKIMLSDTPWMGIDQLRETGLLQHIIPELAACYGCTQSKPWHIYDVYQHTLEALKLVSQEDADLVTRLAILYHDVGKPSTKTVGLDGICHFHGHPEISARLAEESMRRLRFDNDTIQQVVSLVKCHDLPFRSERPAVKKIINKLVSVDLFPKLITIRKSDVMAQNPEEVGIRIQQAEECLAIYSQIQVDETVLKVTDLQVNGHDIMQHGFEGVQIGRILKGLLSLVIEEVVTNDREKLLLIIKTIKEATQ